MKDLKDVNGNSVAKIIMASAKDGEISEITYTFGRYVSGDNKLPEEYLDSQVKTFETEKLILLDGHHRWKYANKENSVNKLKCILINFQDNF